MQLARSVGCMSEKSRRAQGSITSSAVALVRGAGRETMSRPEQMIHGRRIRRSATGFLVPSIAIKGCWQAWLQTGAEIHLSPC